MLSGAENLSFLFSGLAQGIAHRPKRASGLPEPKSCLNRQIVVKVLVSGCRAEKDMKFAYAQLHGLLQTTSN
jgi:hypothetical protein